MMKRCDFLVRMAFVGTALAFLPKSRWADDRPMVAWIGDQGFLTIQDALDAVNPGGVIQLAPMHHSPTEPYRLFTDGVTIQGNGASFDGNNLVGESVFVFDGGTR